MNLRSLTLVSALVTAGAANANIVISQIYGGGGSTSASTTLLYDYIELQNNGTSAMSLNGLSLQYASATGAFGSSTSNIAALPNITLASGQFFLVQGASASVGGTALQSDLLSGLNLSATSGKLVVFNGTTAAGTIASNATGVLDFVGYGSSATTYEGAVGPAPTISTTLTDIRNFAGGLAIDTNNNSVDFTAVTTTTNSFHNTTGVAKPVPEPGAFAALGVGAIALLRRRRAAK